MSAVFFIRIIGGVFGGTVGAILSGKIYQFMYKQIKPAPQPPPPPAITFEDIFHRELEQSSPSTPTPTPTPPSHTIEKKTALWEDTTGPILVVNDALYDNDFTDYYIFIGR